jgi:P2 family phage contractile tail tube protein
MAARDIRKNFNLFVAGRGYAGQIEEFNAPKLTLVTSEFRAGGMDAPIDLDMGMEKMTCDFSMKSYDAMVLALFGLKIGENVPLIAREALESADGTVTAVTHIMRGKVTAIDPGTSKPGEPPVLKVDMSLSFYSMTHGVLPIHVIDVENMVRIIAGVDQLAATRAALAI